MFKVFKGFGYFLASFLLFTSFSSMAEEESEFKAKTLQVSWKISGGYYLYQTRISATQNGQPLSIKFQQTALDKKDEYFGKVKIFKHNLDILTALQNNSPIALIF